MIARHESNIDLDLLIWSVASVAILNQVDWRVNLRSNTILKSKRAKVVQISLEFLSESFLVDDGTTLIIIIHQTQYEILINFLEGVSEWLMTLLCNFLRYLVQN